MEAACDGGVRGTAGLIFTIAPYLHLLYIAHEYVLVKLVNPKNPRYAKILGMIDFLIFAFIIAFFFTSSGSSLLNSLFL